MVNSIDRFRADLNNHFAIHKSHKKVREIKYYEPTYGRNGLCQAEILSECAGCIHKIRQFIRKLNLIEIDIQNLNHADYFCTDIWISRTERKCYHQIIFNNQAALESFKTAMHSNKQI